MYGTEFARVSGSYSTAYIGTYELLRQEGNSSVFKLRAYFYYGGGLQVNSSVSGGFYLDGTWVHSGSYSNVTPGYHLWGEKEITVNHNTDGSFPGRYVEISGQSYHIKGSAGGYLSAPKINRQANILTAPNFNDEENPTITYENPAGNNITSLKACIASTDGQKIYVPYREISKTGTSYTFNLTDAERKSLRQALTANSMYVAFYVTTVIDGQTFYSLLQRLLTLINANPEFSNFTFKDINTKTIALTGNNQNIIKGYSNVQATIPVANKAIAKKETTMNKYRFTCGDKADDKSYSDTADVNLTINGVPNGTFTVYATDKRDNSTPVTKLANQVVDYSPLTKISIDAYRSGGVSEEVILQLEGTINVVNFGKVTNSIKTAKVKYRVAKTSEWSTEQDITLEVVDGKFSYNGAITGDLESKGFNISNSYEVEVIVTDELSSVTFTDTFSSGTPNIAYHKNGISVMGKYDVDEGGLFQVAGKNVIQKNIMTIYSDSRFDLNVVANSANKLNGLKNYISIGKKLSYSDASIVIGKNVSKVLISAGLAYWYSTTSAQCMLIITKNSEMVLQRYDNTPSDQYETESIVLNPVLLDVKEGDKIALNFYSGSAQQIGILTDRLDTNLTVEVVE